MHELFLLMHSCFHCQNNEHKGKSSLINWQYSTLYCAIEFLESRFAMLMTRTVTNETIKRKT